MAIDFGYFTLSDNHYPDNPRTANDFVMEIREQAILADKLGYSSAWIGEHHFDRLGVNSRPDILLASIIPETTNIRLAPRGKRVADSSSYPCCRNVGDAGPAVRRACRLCLRARLRCR